MDQLEAAVIEPCGSVSSSTPTEEYSLKGISLWYDQPLKLCLWLLSSGSVTRIMLVVMMAFVAIVMTVFETLVLCPVLVVLMPWFLAPSHSSPVTRLVLSSLSQKRTATPSPTSVHRSFVTKITNRGLMNSVHLDYKSAGKKSAYQDEENATCPVKAPI